MRVLLTIPFLVLGCVPEGGGGGGRDAVFVGQGGSGGASGDGAVLPTDDGGQVDSDGGGGMGGEGGMGGMGGEGMGGMGGDDGCQPGDQRCADEGQPFYERCTVDRVWAVEACDEGDLCFDGTCLPNPVGCERGERICLDGQQPAECQDDAWVPVEQCQGDQRCREGECSAVACAEAAAQRSYLGCDYLAVSLPNSALLAGDQGTTPNAPIGVVLANPDFGAPVHVTVRDPAGAIAGLVPQRNIPLPAIPEVQQRYQPQTVRSEVKDGGGMVVEQNIDRAELLEIPPGGIATLLLPQVAPADPDSGVRREAFRITTDRPVAAYQFSPYCCNYSFSNDASLLFPVSALGLDYRYLGVPSWNQPLAVGAGSPAGIAIVGSVDGTEVTVNLREAGRLRPDNTGRLQINGRQVTARLDAQEVVFLQATNGDPLMDLDPMTFQMREPDLSGAQITATSPVAVFSTHMCTFYPQALSACDHVEEQLFPTGTWGNTFTLVPPVSRGNGGIGAAEYIYWKIIARDPGTRITLSAPYNSINPQPPGFAGVPDCRASLQGNQIVLNGTDYCEFGTDSPVQITGDGPLMVMGIVSGQESTGIGQPFGAQAGDPAIFLVPPDRQYRQDYPFLTPATYAHDYLTVVADPGAQILLDDVPVNLADAIAVPGTDRVFKHIEITDGQHRVAGNRPFGILVFAFDDFVSYAFTGGLNLEKR